MMWTRRAFIKSGGLAVVSLGSSPPFLERLALASGSLPSSGRPKVLVSIFLRGAMDGLMAASPLDEPALRRLRPHLAMSAASSSGSGLVDLDGRFGLHRAFDPLLPFWAEGRLALVHGVGSPNATRSHFDAQDFMETGTPWNKGTPSGWLGRVAAARGASSSPFRAVSITRELPRSLYGEQSALAIADLADFELVRSLPRSLRDEAVRDLEKLYREGSRGLLKARAREMFDAASVFSSSDLATYRRQRGGFYPSSRLGQSLLQIAFMIRRNVGLEIAFAESDGWDTHVDQGTSGGAFATRADDLARSIAAFWRDIEEYHEDVVVLTMTEFGRTVAENGSGGTDHGHGSCLFVLGNPVDGGKVYGELPGLTPEALFEGRDLPVTTDFRAVFSEVAGKQFGITDDESLFPGWEGERLPVFW